MPTDISAIIIFSRGPRSRFRPADKSCLREKKVDFRIWIIMFCRKKNWFPKRRFVRSDWVNIYWTGIGSQILLSPEKLGPLTRSEVYGSAELIDIKLEARNPKYETNSNDQNPNVQNKFTVMRWVLSCMFWAFEHSNLIFVSDFDIRISDLTRSTLKYPLPGVSQAWSFGLGFFT